ncbi:MAG: WYL domain-containing protein [Lachnospiraceae bacterium]|nr:WYL domain-containing protein [Lachnospiraceae bacterium]
MAKSANQKLKLLYIIDMLERESDENHIVSTQDIIKMLEANDISAERKSIYDDMNQLSAYGYDIIQVKSRVNGGYYLASREFELAELKLLVDAVQSSKFITRKKSRELIQKLERLTSKHEASQLQRQVYVSDSAKTENENIYYSVDGIHKGIHDNMQISFTYLEWSVSKQLVPKRAGKTYQVSPWALLWQDENYYLVAYDSDAEKMKHYRVDKMGKVTVTAKQREGYEVYEKMNLPAYANQTFGMYGGKWESVTMQFPEKLIGVVIDRFGKDIMIRKKNDGFFTITVNAAVSGQFFGWLTGIGKDAKLIGPEHVKEEYENWLKEILAQ